MTSERVKNTIKQICEELASMDKDKFFELLKNYKETDITDILFYSEIKL